MQHWIWIDWTRKQEERQREKEIERCIYVQCYNVHHQVWKWTMPCVLFLRRFCTHLLIPIVMICIDQWWYRLIIMLPSSINRHRLNSNTHTHICMRFVKIFYENVLVVSNNFKEKEIYKTQTFYFTISAYFIRI